jgi:SAM-dependent methyltransferase
MTEQAAESAERVARLFDAKAPTWPAKYAPAGRLADRLVRLAGAAGEHTRPGGSILDLGCGTGELARGLAAAGRRVTGADISPQMLSRAVTADRRGAVEWIQLDPGWRALPCAARAFDAVVASSVLEYVDEPAAVLSECARVLRPGGTLLVTVPDIRHPVRWAEWAASLVARLPLARSGRRAPPGFRGLHGYLAYLRVSRQRHLLRWWHAAAKRAGLSAVPAPEGERRPATLRVLAFRRPGDQGEAS